MNTEYSTKVTAMNGKWVCAVWRGGKIVVYATVDSRDMIGPAFRDLLRTLDKCGGDQFTAAARKRKYRDGNVSIGVKHRWGAQ